jgi:hypothetical protein
MGDEPCRESRSGDELKGIELDVWLDERLEQLLSDVLVAKAAGDDAQVKLHIERFESAVGRLPRKQRDGVIADATVWLGEELRARGF